MSTRKRYTKEFKLEAVRLLEQGGRRTAHRAAERVTHIILRKRV